ncbi:hypothetical protein DKG74_20135 [Zavarzinia aquatilis]|uniref:Uncharacterized protein n=2 Tax=Zavarzinia aquatilis TaxID=2211142 RepID=A0A317DTA3_9PROT|nr:hypothetical protein DKG74_20135 [Zavarzinia aquatilis]
MFPRSRLFVLLALALAAGFPDGAGAGSDGGVPSSASTSAGDERYQLDDLLVAQDLFRLAVRNRDVLAIVAAARIVAATPFTRIEDVPEGGYAAPAGDAAAAKPFATLEDMLADARRLAAGNATMLTLIDDIGEGSAALARGASATSVTGIFDVPPGAVHVFRRPFRAGTPAVAAIVADGPGVLEMTVADDRDRAICTDEGTASIGRCSWLPLLDGEFLIIVRNTGMSPLRYNLLLH